MKAFTTPDQFTAANTAAIESIQSLANAAFARSERLTALNFNTARAVLQDGVANGKALIAAKDPQELLKLQASLTQPVIDNAIAYARSAYEIASEGQNEVSKLFETHFADLNKTLADALDQVAKSAPAGSEPAFAAIKSAMAATNSAYDAMSKAAKQACASAEANLATATNTAVKSARATKKA